MSFEGLNLEIDGKGEKINKSEAVSDIMKISNIQDNFSEIGKKEEKIFDKNQKNNLQKDVSIFLEQAANDELGNHLSEFNSDNFDKDGEKGLDKFEFENFTEAIEGAIDQIILLDGFGKFSEVHEESADEDLWARIAFSADFQEHILGDENGKSIFEKTLLQDFSEEELEEMSEREFKISEEGSLKNLGILISKEIGEGWEDALRLLGNTPSGLLLLPRYLSYRIDINSNNAKERTEGEIKIKELVEDNPSLAILDLLGEKGVEMLKSLGEAITSGKTGDVAMGLSMIIGAIGGIGLAKLANKTRKFHKKNDKKIENENISTEYNDEKISENYKENKDSEYIENKKEKEVKNKENQEIQKEFETLKPTLDKLENETNLLKEENMVEMKKEINYKKGEIEDFNEKGYANAYYNTDLTGLKNRTSLLSSVSEIIQKKGKLIVFKADIDNLGSANKGWSKNIDKMVENGLISEKQKFIIGDFLIARNAKAFRQVGKESENMFPGLKFKNFQEGGDEFSSVVDLSDLKKDLDGNYISKNGEKFSEEGVQNFIGEKFREQTTLIQKETKDYLGEDLVDKIAEYTVENKGQPHTPDGAPIDVRNQIFVSSAGSKQFNFADFKISEKIEEIFKDRKNFTEAEANYEISKYILSITDDGLEHVKNHGIDGEKRNMILNVNTGEALLSGGRKKQVGEKINSKDAANEMNYFKIQNVMPDKINQKLTDKLFNFFIKSKARKNEKLENFNNYLNHFENKNDRINIENFIRNGDYSKEKFQKVYENLENSGYKDIKEFKLDINHIYKSFIKTETEKGHYTSFSSNLNKELESGILKKEDLFKIEILHGKPINELLGHIMMDKIILAKEIIFGKAVENFVKNNLSKNLQGEKIFYQASHGPGTQFGINKNILRENGYSEKEIKKLQKDFIKNITKEGNIGLKEIKDILGKEFLLKAYKFIRRNQNDKFKEIIENGKTKKEAGTDIINEVLQVGIEKK